MWSGEDTKANIRKDTQCRPMSRRCGFHANDVSLRHTPHEKLLGITWVPNPATRKDLAARTWDVLLYWSKIPVLFQTKVGCRGQNSVSKKLLVRLHMVKNRLAGDHKEILSPYLVRTGPYSRHFDLSVVYVWAQWLRINKDQKPINYYQIITAHASFICPNMRCAVSRVWTGSLVILLKRFYPVIYQGK